METGTTKTRPAVFAPTYHPRQVLELTVDLGEPFGDDPAFFERPKITAAFYISSSPFSTVRLEGGIDVMLDTSWDCGSVLLLHFSEDLPAISGPVVRVCETYSAFTECEYRLVGANSILIHARAAHIVRLFERFKVNRENFCDATRSMVVALQTEGMN